MLGAKSRSLAEHFLGVSTMFDPSQLPRSPSEGGCGSPEKSYLRGEGGEASGDSTAQRYPVTGGRHIGTAPIVQQRVILANVNTRAHMIACGIHPFPTIAPMRSNIHKDLCFNKLRLRRS